MQCAYSFGNKEFKKPLKIHRTKVKVTKQKKSLKTVSMSNGDRANIFHKKHALFILYCAYYALNSQTLPVGKLYH